MIFLLSGLWHGANWTFIAWGVYHALLFLPLILLGKNRKYTGTIAEGKFLPSFKELCMMLLTFALVVIGWIFFRAETIADAIHYIAALCSPEIWKTSFEFWIYPTNNAGWFVIIMLIVEWLLRDKEHGLDIRNIKYGWLRIIIYYTLIVVMFWFSGKSETFIYFQF